MKEKINGTCFYCGEVYSKVAMKNHILKKHNQLMEEECYLVKVEGKDDKNYWLYLDIALDKSLNSLDSFLRKIWLECCGHLSQFYIQQFETIAKSTKLYQLNEGARFYYEYDFGSYTDLIITIVGKTTRFKQREAIRLLARNNPHEFECSICGKKAIYICPQCYYINDLSTYFCKECLDKHDHNYFLPITNSPRCGICDYKGESDIYEYRGNNSIKL